MVRFLLILVAVLCSSLLSFSQELPDKMRLLVNDYADILTDAEEQALERKLSAFNKSAKSDIEIVTVKELGNTDVNDYARKLANYWSVDGSKKSLVLLVDLKEHRYGIAATKELSDIITEDIAVRIEEKYIKPNFRHKHYYQGLSEASDVIMDLAAGRYAPDKLKTDHGGNLFIIILVLFLFLFIFLPYMQYRAIKKAHIGSRKMSIIDTVMMMNSFSPGNTKAAFDDFSESKGKFEGRAFGGFVSGGGGAAGHW